MTVPNRKQSKRFIMSWFVILFLGWLLLLAWTMTRWTLFGFEKTCHVINQLLREQTQLIVVYHPVLPTEYLSSIDFTQIKTSLPPALTDAYLFSLQLWTLIRLTTQLMIIKLSILIAAIPLFTLTMTAGLVDGLNQRAIRTYSLGRESSYVFHQVNRFFKRGFIWILAVWLALPISINPAILFVPLSIVLSVMVSITACRFKKYL
ncbi:hypothetical protein Lsan_3892 [Legionella santicrucis]|uniref:Fe2+/Zn2+ uptake regulation protein n=1 Tax=Legionella santicrucis TaxID=45074 RepID=A0A0W0Y9G5_9GAMM|nr:DUF4400 domain-containing protein [Legionella santicrucis]KTD53482.1 hypothetical protein Lsan_3892 [Legionella santicrucis]